MLDTRVMQAGDVHLRLSKTRAFTKDGYGEGNSHEKIRANVNELPWVTGKIEQVKVNEDRRSNGDHKHV